MHSSPHERSARPWVTYRPALSSQSLKEQQSDCSSMLFDQKGCVAKQVYKKKEQTKKKTVDLNGLEWTSLLWITQGQRRTNK